MSVSLVPPAGADELREGAAASVGVRPERLASPASGAFSTQGPVEFVERPAESSFAHIRLADGAMLVAEAPGRQTPKAGETVRLGADLHDLHVFDEGGRRVELGAG
ncbi:MAG: TOBE domain-containing protein [Roseiarcus sp.]